MDDVIGGHRCGGGGSDGGTATRPPPGGQSCTCATFTHSLLTCNTVFQEAVAGTLVEEDIPEGERMDLERALAMCGCGERVGSESVNYYANIN